MKSFKWPAPRHKARGDRAFERNSFESPTLSMPKCLTDEKAHQSRRTPGLLLSACLNTASIRRLLSLRPLTSLPRSAKLVLALLVCISALRSGFRHKVSNRSLGDIAHKEAAPLQFFNRYVLPFCQTQPGMRLAFLRTDTIHPNSCFGAMDNATSSIELDDIGVLAPSLGALCAQNPYHGFFDCLWPLVHYISTCTLPKDRARITVLTTVHSLQKRRRISWVAYAQHAYLAATGVRVVHTRDLSPNHVVCFRRTVRFSRNKLWRPLMFGVSLRIGKNRFSNEHPEPLKRAGMRAFRAGVLSSLDLSANAFPPDARPQVLIYDRLRTKRRRWRNANNFARRLKYLLADRIDIKYVSTMPASFAGQVALFNRASIHIAPHGAAMANTLFMRENSAVIEIASRQCSTTNDYEGVIFNAAAMQTDPNAWTVWHTGFLGIHLVHAPCVTMDKGSGDFEVHIPSLVRLTQMMINAQLVNSGNETV